MSHLTTIKSAAKMVKIGYRSVKTRRKSLVSNKVFLRIGETGCITAETRRTAEIRGEERQKPKLNIGKDKNSKKVFIYKVAAPL